jgi:hypothetical protein
MQTWNRFSLAIVLAGSFSTVATPQSQSGEQTRPQASSSGAPVTTVAQAIDRIIAREHDENTVIKRYSPIVETYVQDMKTDPQMGVVPFQDHYYLGEASLANGVVDDSMLDNKKKGKGEEREHDHNPFAHLVRAGSGATYAPRGFLEMIYIDPNGFDREHYEFDYAGREFLGEVRCVVFDVRPLPKTGKGRFIGRIWAEDQGFTVVRFNGMFESGGDMNGYNVHFDSWRLNLQSDLWVPAFVFSQESELKDAENGVRFKAQTRFWGYGLSSAGQAVQQEQQSLDSPVAAGGAEATAPDRSPIEVEREWQQQAELNVITRLERIGLLAPRGEVDKVLETVINNLEVTNNLDIQPEIRCRVMLTGTLESFSIGHTIVLSRGLIDVLPDEASLATILAQELAAIIVTKPSTDAWGFNDTTNVTAAEALSRFSFKATPAEIDMSEKKALDLLKHSPYKDKLGTAALFLKQLSADSAALPSLIGPRLGNAVELSADLLALGPPLEPDKLDQIAALPLGSRVKIDPWSDRVELVKSKPVALYSAREKMPFEVTPFLPFLTRYQEMDKAGKGPRSTLADRDGSQR